jgi:hypothetical protein
MLLRRDRTGAMKALAFTMLLLAACGGQITGDGDGGADAGTGDAADASGSVTYDACSGSDGIKLFGGICGQNDCSATVVPPAELGVCFETSAKLYGPCDRANFKRSIDGDVCVPTSVNPDAGLPNAQLAIAYSAAADVGYAIMYAKNGFGSWCHYADRSTYDGTPVPDAPASCPAVSGFELCGGACGDCPQGEYCIGRSPLHPYSVCVTDYSKALEPVPGECVRGAPLAGDCMGNAQNPPSACLTFRVSDADQPFADQTGICTEKSICMAAAAAYPGGAYCTP